ncbi:MAG: pyridoxal phosphate-dependent aminotransferase [Deltaproteobacteria bacterium]|nr:MAG: pyridoxal phosphate-dependent aminotransferase [Deltaproteobacteria bacterium]
MPRPPDPDAAIARVPEEPFSPGGAAGPGPRFPLNIGDTWLDPFVGGRMEDLRAANHPGMNRYAPTQGIPELIDAVVEKVRSRNALPCERTHVLITAGATGGLACAIGMLASPGEEVLILTPCWPLIRGIAPTFRARPVEVPFYDRVSSAEQAVAAVRERITARSVALYVSTPSNPTGRVVPGDWLEALAQLARDADLWLLSDEVYEDYVYRGEHVSVGRFAPERTLSVFSFSKAYGMAGNRTGYLVGPASAVAQARKVGTHTFYSAPTAGQLAALAALRSGDDWLAEARSSYRAAGDAAAEALGLPPPEGGTFLFVPVGDRPGGVERLLSDCLEDGVALAPGSASGHDYRPWVRICFASMPPDRMAEAVRRLARRRETRSQ